MAYIEGEESKPICCLMLTFEMSPRIGGLIYWIQSVYTLPEHRKKGAFKALYNHAVSEAKKDPLAKEVRLYVD